MRVAIEALGIGRPGGGRTATINLVRQLLVLDQENDYLIYLDAPEPSLVNLSAHAKQFIAPFHNRYAARLYLQILLPIHIRRHSIDLIHFVKNQVILGTGAKTVVTVYDLTTLKYPNVYPLVDVLYWRHILPRQFKRIDSLIALSESTASDLVNYYQLSRNRIKVIFPGYDPKFRPATQETIQYARERYGLTKGYFIHVGSFSLKKNLVMLLEAFSDFRKRTGFDGQLVLVGAEYPKGRDSQFTQMLSRPDVSAGIVPTGYVPEDLLLGLYSGALALVFPSLHEGFGLVVLEAMACGTPVVVHGTDALREVVGDSGMILESASDARNWSRAFEEILRDKKLREEMSRASLKRARLFSSEKSARQVLELYQQIVPKD